MSISSVAFVKDSMRGCGGVESICRGPRAEVRVSVRGTNLGKFHESLLA